MDLNGEQLGKKLGFSLVALGGQGSLGLHDGGGVVTGVGFKTSCFVESCLAAITKGWLGLTAEGFFTISAIVTRRNRCWRMWRWHWGVFVSGNGGER